jgi:YihY family inner membrane protein
VSEGQSGRSRIARILRWPVAIAIKLGRVLPEALQRFFADRCTQQAAGIAYRVLFSIAPLAIVLVSIFGLVLQDDSVREDVVNTIVDWLPVSPSGTKDVEDAITSIATPVSAVGLISLVLFAWAASGMMTAIRQGLETAMHVTESRPMARGKLVDLLLIMSAAVLVLVTAGLTLLAKFLQSSSGSVANATGLPAGRLVALLLHGGALVLSVVVVLLLYRFVPARGLSLRDGLAGAIVTGLLLQLVALASAWTYERATRLSVVYGSLTAALVFLYSIYLYSAALLLGAEVAAGWAAPPPTEAAPPIRTQVKEAVLGLFVRPKK